MDNTLAHKILFAHLRSGKPATLKVKGVSMNPTLSENDEVTVESSNEYFPGDILVFLYKNNELLIHRLLFIKNGRYYCKGDNAMRLEDIDFPQIAGKAVLRNGIAIPEPPEHLVELSYLVNRCFRKNGYNSNLTKQSGIYRFYKKYIENKEDKTMTYQKNDSFDYIQADETGLAVFDAESGNTYLFDETGIDILKCLETPCTLDELLDRLCEIYDATPDFIRADVEEFLEQTVANKVVIVS